METQETAIIGITVALVVGIIDLTKMLVRKITGKESVNGRCLDCPISPEDRDMIRSIHTLSTKTDPDGMPLMWFPRKTTKDIEDIKHQGDEHTALLRSIDNTLKKNGH